ncbi:ent-kaurene synthase, chloroplastic-like [Alnus glutinosa]|uniref:ent-kaurene synthase, chloroplastic-like n=1 Tax=Alnus glutinosa TaxID=3517 RepID=UPI002D7A050A|nr:ent-kaurene synthase, chloroplastic-like [Alnus glutinosa]XP_062170078.1 ent-kaurene synthase, chloroplastic-like [Alnus glutinosa]
MSIVHANRPWCFTSSTPVSVGILCSQAASMVPGSNVATKAKSPALCFEETKQRIKKMFNKVELSLSSYDTAWVAMVPSPHSLQAPFFPQCVNWLLDNQLCDGSWGLPNRDPFLVKDALLSTLACIVALKQWGVGEEQLNNGLFFIESNIAAATDEKQLSPIGFDIIFPAMIEYAKNLDLNIPLGVTNLEALVHKGELELKTGYGSNSEGRRTYLAYLSEGLGKSQDWEMVMKYQRENGSLFNSPATTAAAFTHLKNSGCLQYLCSLLEKFGNAVPTVYPLDIYVRLFMIDSLERLGIGRHFREEIKSVLDETYRYWLQGKEELFLDATTCAMAFRMLRVNGYDVSSDPFTRFSQEHQFSSTLGGHLKDIGAVLELFRASEIIIHHDESVLEKQNFLTRHFLRRELSNGSIHTDRLNKYLVQEVDNALKFPYHANLERLSNRRAIEHYNKNNTRILKTSYCSSNIGNEDFLKLAVEDFNICQSIHREELSHLARWVTENRLDKLKFARQKLAYCYFSAVATLFPSELSDARISWAKNGVLTTVVDDFFDVGGSEEELVNLIQLVEKWDVNVNTDCCSEKVEIIFSALHSTISEIGDKALTWQGRSVISDIIDIWLNLLKSMLKEAEWLRDKSMPTMDEYMTNGCISFALGPIVLPALYFLGPKLSEEVVRAPEICHLFELMSTCGRFLNDIQSFKRESDEGKLNAVSLCIIHGDGINTEEEAVKELKSFIASRRRELLKLVLQEKSSVVPRACKDLFWKMIKVLHLFYRKDDGFTSDEMINVVNAIIEEPIVLNAL